MKIRTLLMVLCAVVGVTLLSGCSKGSPESTVKAWHKAILKGDKAAADELVTGKDAKETNKAKIAQIKDWRKAATKEEDDNKADQLKFFEKAQIGKADFENEDKATVAVTYGEKEVEFKLRKSDKGVWKIKITEVQF